MISFVVATAKSLSLKDFELWLFCWDQRVAQVQETSNICINQSPLYTLPPSPSPLYVKIRLRLITSKTNIDGDVPDGHVLGKVLPHIRPVLLLCDTYCSTHEHRRDI